MRTALLLCAAAAALAQQPPGWLMSGSGTLSNGVVIEFRCIAQPPLSGKTLKISLGGVKQEGGRIHRYMVDRESNSYFGYDLTAEPAGNGTYRVNILPLQPLKELTGLAPAAAPQLPPPQTIHEGQEIALDLLASADGTQKIVDYIRISTRRSPSPPNSSPASNRDYTIDDGPLNFPAQGEYQVYVNGQLQPAPGLTQKRGSTLWFAFPGQGRFILSLEPRFAHDSRVQGTLRDNVIQFESGADKYEIRCPARIIDSSAAFRLYVLHDPAYTPPRGADRLILGGIDRLENLVPR